MPGGAGERSADARPERVAVECARRLAGESVEYGQPPQPTSGTMNIGETQTDSFKCRKMYGSHTVLLLFAAETMSSALITLSLDNVGCVRRFCAAANCAAAV